MSNFRGIKNGHVDDLSNINIFVGKNNSGKSSILEAIMLLSMIESDRNAFHEPILTQLLNRRVSRGTNTNPRSLWYDYDTEKNIDFDLQFDGAKLNFKFSHRLNWSITSPQLIGDYSLYKGEGSTLMLFNKDGSSAFHRTDLASLEENMNQSGLHGTAVMGLLRSLHKCFIIDSSLTKEFPLIEKYVLRNLLTARKDKVVLNILNQAYGTKVEALSYIADERNEYSLLLMLPNKSVRVDEMGDGFRFALVILSLMVSSGMKIALIEEMENHQHPSAMKSIAKAVVNYSIENGIQLFMTTHNVELIKALIAAAENALDKLRIYHFSLNDGILDARPIKGMDAKVVDDMGLDLRSLTEYG